jgi:hypothetical protein
MVEGVRADIWSICHFEKSLELCRKVLHNLSLLLPVAHKAELVWVHSNLVLLFSRQASILIVMASLCLSSAMLASRLEHAR